MVTIMLIDVLVGLLFVLVWYVLAGFAVYLYAVILNKQYIGVYIWKLEKEYIGICMYPQWLFFWMYWIVNFFRKESDNQE